MLRLVHSQRKPDAPKRQRRNKRIPLEERMDAIALALDELEGRMSITERLTKRLARLLAKLAPKL